MVFDSQRAAVWRRRMKGKGFAMDDNGMITTDEERRAKEQSTVSVDRFQVSSKQGVARSLLFLERARDENVLSQVKVVFFLFCIGFLLLAWTLLHC